MRDYRERLSGCCVGIAGAGGLGSNCAVALARIGVGRLIVADFDVVTEDNLNRQYFFRDQVGMSKVKALADNIRRIDPRVAVEAHHLKLEPGIIREIFAPCQVIVEAFDLAEMKQMIIETVLMFFQDTYLVAASGLAGYGGNNRIRTRRFGKLFICGDGISEVSENLPPLAPRVGITAAMQANQVLELLLDEVSPCLSS